MKENIKRSRCRMKFINDDEHIKTVFGYNRLDIRHKQCVKCRTTRTKYRETHKAELMENMEYYYENKEELNKKKMEHDNVYHSEKVCNICGKTIPRKAMFKHNDWPSGKAIANLNFILKRWMMSIKKTYTVWVKPN